MRYMTAVARAVKDRSRLVPLTAQQCALACEVQWSSR